MRPGPACGHHDLLKAESLQGCIADRAGRLLRPTLTGGCLPTTIGILNAIN